MSDQNRDQKDKLLQIMRAALLQDQELREKHQMGEKFRFIRDRLNALAAQVEEHLTTLHQDKHPTADSILPDEVLVYVYLYNAQGVVMQTWQKMLTPAVFYEYSVNRPIYMEKAHVDAFIRRRSNPIQHGYLTIAVKKDHILTLPEAEQTKDALENPLFKVKEGTLHFERLISFTHADVDYVVNAEGELVKKNQMLS